MFNLYFTNLKQEAPVKALIVPGQGVAHLVFAGKDHKPWHDYSAPVEEMVALLRELLHQVETIQAGGNPLKEEL